MTIILYFFLYISILFNTLSFFNLLDPNIIRTITLTISLFLIITYRKKIQLVIWKLTDYFKLNYLAIYLIISLSTLFYLAVQYLPNNSDSMTYHLPRIFHWFQNENLAFYQTSIIRQLYSAPFDEILMAFSFAMIRNYHIFNLVHLVILLFILITSIKLTYLIYKKTEFIILPLILSTPVVILQAISTQNNLLLTLFILLIYYYTFILISQKENYNKCLVNLSILLNLSIYTKGTAYFFLLPILIYLVSWLISRKKLMLKFLFLNILFLVLINSSFLINNYKTFNSIVPDNQSIYTQRNSIYSLNQFISNFSRNFSYQLITNVDPINNFNYRVVSKIHKLIKLDINDSRTTWPSQNYYSIFSHLYLIQSEDISPNFLLIILFIVSLVYILFNLKSTNKKILIITILNISGFLIFSFAIKWQPWHSRLLLPILIITNFTILEFLNKLPKIIKVLLITLLIYYSVPFYIKNQNRPLLNMRKNQIEQITSPRMNTTSTFLEFEKYYLKNRGKINQIGLIIGSDDYEFPFWFITKRDYNNSKVKIFHCFVNNGSKIYKNNCKNSDIYIFTKENLGLVKKIKKYNRIIKYDYFILIEI